MASLVEKAVKAGANAAATSVGYGTRMANTYGKFDKTPSAMRQKAIRPIPSHIGRKVDSPVSKVQAGAASTSGMSPVNKVQVGYGTRMADTYGKFDKTPSAMRKKIGTPIPQNVGRPVQANAPVSPSAAKPPPAINMPRPAAPTPRTPMPKAGIGGTPVRSSLVEAAAKGSGLTKAAAIGGGVGLSMMAGAAGGYLAEKDIPTAAVGGAIVGGVAAFAVGNSQAALRYAGDLADNISAKSGKVFFDAAEGMDATTTEFGRAAAFAAGGGLGGMALGASRDRRSGFNKNRGNAIRR